MAAVTESDAVVEDWSDVDPQLLASIIEECFGGEDATLTGTAAADATEQRISSAFESTFESIVKPFLASVEPNLTPSAAHASQADHIASLHNGLTDCNARLLQMEEALNEFHSRILDVCTEIEVLRSEAVGTRAARDGKRSLQRHIGALLDLVIIPPDVVHLVLMTPEYQQRGAMNTPLADGGGFGSEELSQQFILSVRRLHKLIRKRIANQDIVLGRSSSPTTFLNKDKRQPSFTRAAPGSSLSSTAPTPTASQQHQHELVLKLFRCRAFREMVATTEDLLIFVCMRIRSFLEAKITALENPRTNSVVQQEHVLRGHRQLVRFMQDGCAYLKMTVSVRPVTAAIIPEDTPASLTQQHKPFVPYRIVKALYDDLKVQYLTVLSRVYTGRMGRYLTALTEIQLGHQGGDANAAAQQSVASSVVGGLTSLFWGSSAAAAETTFGGGPSGGPSHQEQLKVVAAMTKPPLIGDRCSIGPFAMGASPSSSADAALAVGTMTMGHEVIEDLKPFSLGQRVTLFRSDDLATTVRASLSGDPLEGTGNSSTYAKLLKGAAADAAVPSLGDNCVDPHEDSSIFKAPTIPHINRMRRQYHTYEETFRSINHLVADTVTHEYLFLLDFFGVDSWQMCVDIFRKTFQNVVDHISDKMLLNAPRADLVQQSSSPSAAAAAIGSAHFSPFVSGNKDIGGLLSLFRMTLIFRAQMIHVRQLHILEPYYHSILSILWPAIHAALEDHVRSLRVCGSLAADRIHALNGGGNSSRNTNTARAAPPPPPSAKAIAAVHPVAARYAEMSCMIMQLADFSFVTHYSKLREAEAKAIKQQGGGAGGTGQNSAVASPNLPAVLTPFNASVGVNSPAATVSPGAEGSILPVPYAVAAEEDEDEHSLRTWITVLRGNLSVMRIEVCRLLGLHCKVYADACNAILRGRLADEYGGGGGSNRGPTSPPSAQLSVKVTTPTDERLWMAASAPMVNGLYHILRTWEQRLLSPRQAEALRRANGDVANLGKAVTSGYDLAASLPTGLRGEWARAYHSSVADPNSSTTATPIANPRLPVFQQQQSFPFQHAPTNDPMTFNLLSNLDYVTIKDQLVKAQQQFTKIVVALACPSLSHLPSLQTTFDDETLAEDLLMLSVQYDPDDVSEIEIKGEDEDSYAQRGLRYSSERDGSPVGGGIASSQPSIHADNTPITTRVNRLVRYCKVVLAKCTHFAQSWEADVKMIRRFVFEYLLHPDHQRAMLVSACSLLLTANTQLHEQLTGSVAILNKLHAWRDREGMTAEMGVGSLPPAVTTMAGLVVTNHQLLEHLRSFVAIESAHDAHPDL